MEDTNIPTNNQNISSQQEQVSQPVDQVPPLEQPPEHSYKKMILVIIGAIILVIILSTIFFVLTQKGSLPKPSGNESSQNPSPTISAEMKKALDEAKQSAKDYNNQLGNLRESYPWLRRLPLSTEKYYVYFDLETNKFIGYLFVKAGDDPELLKADAINKLRIEKEIPVDNFQFEWSTNP